MNNIKSTISILQDSLSTTVFSADRDRLILAINTLKDVEGKVLSNLEIQQILEILTLLASGDHSVNSLKVQNQTKNLILLLNKKLED